MLSDHRKVIPPIQSGPTGDMTLCVYDQVGLRIARIDMLAQSTMKAGLNGERLARALNDLSIIAWILNREYYDNLNTGDNQIDIPIPHPEAGISPSPWTVLRTDKRYNLLDCKKNKIAELSFKGSPDQAIVECWNVLGEYILRFMNQMVSFILF